MGVILVTGGAGYIGSHVVWALVDAGREVVVLDDLSFGRRQALPASVPLVVGSVTDVQLVGRLLDEHKIQSVMHFAGRIQVAESVREPLGYYATNTVGSHVLISACAARGIERFVFSSTAAVYGIPEELPVAETATLAPINPYGASKLMTEWMLRDAAAAGILRYIALRYFNVAGADPQCRTGECRPVASHLINIATQAALGKRAVVSVNGEDYDTPDGTCVRDYVHVSDLAEAHVLALKALEDGGPSLQLNCGYGHGFSVREVLDGVGAVAGKQLNIVSAPRRPGDPPALVAAAGRIRDILGWQPRFDDLPTIIRHALAWESTLA